MFVDWPSLGPHPMLGEVVLMRREHGALAFRTYQMQIGSAKCQKKFSTGKVWGPGEWWGREGDDPFLLGKVAFESCWEGDSTGQQGQERTLQPGDRSRTSH